MMRHSLLAIAVVLLPALALPTPVQAAANGCALPNAVPVRVPTPFLVPPPFPNALGPATCTVAPVVTPPGPVLPVQNGLRFVSTTAACPALPFVGALPGQFCGPLVPGLATVTCTAVWTAFNIDDRRAFVVGLDSIVPLTADGNVNEVLVTDHEPLRYEGPNFNGVFSVQVTNPLPVSARVIAYPVDGPFSLGAPVAVGCL